MIQPWQQALAQELESWRGTPWVAGQQAKGRGVDCVHFVTGVLDALYGYLDRPAIPRLPQDLSVHDRAGAMRAAHAIVRRYPSRCLAAGEALEPGDVLVARSSQAGGLGHVALVGVRGELWHAAVGAGVCTTGPGAFPTVLEIWRPLERESWQKR